MIDQRTRETCQRKRQRGNVFVSEWEAELQAAHMSLYTGRKIKPYKCAVCADWHIGTDRRYEER